MDNAEQTPQLPASHLTAAHLDEDEPPPVVRTWGRLYTVVICYLAFLVVLLYIFSRVFTS